VRDVAPFAGRAGVVWRVALKPSDAPGVVAALGDEVSGVVADWGGGLLWLLCPGGGAGIRRAVGQGHATLWRVDPRIADAPVFPPEGPALAALAEGLRARFDPRGLFNPGLMEA
jgi:glycolate oxidase FAD binding subunit